MSATKTQEESGTYLLVAIEPRIYRHAIGGAIATLRPDLSVCIIEPDDLDHETTQGHPRLVLCSREKHPAASPATDWIEYHFPAKGQPTILVNGQSLEEPALDFDEMLALIDRALARTVEAP